MISLILVSHSGKLVEGLVELIEQMVGSAAELQLIGLGGTEDGRLGTDGLLILKALEDSQAAEHTFVFCDLGSAIISAEAALDLLAEPASQRVSILKGIPFVEGAFVAAVEVSIGRSKEQISQSLKKLVKEMGQYEND